MKPALKLVLACAPMVFIAACGGGDDLEDRLDVADPVVRFVHASPLAPNVTLYRADVAQPNATNVAYLSASNYDNTSTAAADWTLKTASGNVQVGSSINVDPQRGNKYTFVALPTSTGNSMYVIRDPYNKPLSSESTKLRVMNASFNAANIDVYMTTGTNADLSAANPLIPATAYNTSGPASGSDSIDIPGNNATTNPSYQLRIFAAGTKTAPLFSGRVTFGNNQDVLLLTVPDLTNGGIKVLKKVEGTGAATEVAPG